MTFETVDQIFASIDKTRQKLVDTVSGLSDEEVDFRPQPEKWSVAQITEHLAKTEASIVPLIKKLLRKAEENNITAGEKISPPVSFAEMSAKIENTKLVAPEMIRPESTDTIAESLAKLQQTRTAVLELRPRLEAVDLSVVEFPHPFFGPMNLYYWLAFIGLHEMHHLRQIKGLLTQKAEAVNG
jgi:uncharacterized damage-inducible protein DinB